MILHILSDEKFTEYALAQFSEQGMDSCFVVLTYSSHLEYTTPNSAMRVIRPYSKEFQVLLESFKDYKAIVLHGLFWRWDTDVLNSVPDSVKVAWVLWGGDLYGRVELRENYLSPLSKHLRFIHRLGHMLKRGRRDDHYEVPYHLLKRIDYCMTDIPEDFAFAQKYLESDIKCLWYNYYSIDDTLGDCQTEIVEGHDVLIGNSSSLECNHLNGFWLLRKFSLGDSKVVVPLSYGQAWLRNQICFIGRVVFGKRFFPLTSFIPREEYNQIIHDCSTVIMPHYRPQAFGNILTALWLGARVFLSERNVLFAYFRRIGAVVFSIERDLKKSNSWVLSPLPENEIMQNRTAIKALYNKDVMRQKNVEIVKTLNM